MTCQVEFFGGPARGKLFEWHTTPPPLVWRFPVPPVLSVVEADVPSRLVAEYELCSSSSGYAFAYVYKGTRLIET